MYGRLAEERVVSQATTARQVAAAIIYRDGNILITRRAPGEKLAGMWEFPGGKFEPGETPQSCIIRELREELGVESDAGEILISIHLSRRDDRVDCCDRLAAVSRAYSAGA